ncbi:MAG: prepilin-type N-terminal cleavage/methylation domain-containing protein [Candidatus Electrothrix sp. AW3_4]|nr:prepilin-type N-terminal cleavage/methylation domain-containing protein [Candidatus Electrothrix gigas]
MKKKLPNKFLSVHGFTLIELMFVIAIIGILVAVAIPNFIAYRNQAFIPEALTMTGGIRQLIADSYAYTGRFPTDNKALGLLPPKYYPGKYVKSVAVENGAVHVQFSRNSRFPNEVLTIRPAVPEASPQGNFVVWICGYAKPAASMTAFGKNKTSIDKKYLSKVCW